MAQAASRLSASDPSVEQVAGAINAMIAERAAERLQRTGSQSSAKAPAAAVHEPGVYVRNKLARDPAPRAFPTQHRSSPGRRRLFGRFRAAGRLKWRSPWASNVPPCGKKW